MSTKRRIFEEVEARAAPTVTGAIDARGGGARRAIRVWLGILFALVVLMIAVGGMTRLTDSGLSITEWAPVTGALPPLSAGAWQAEFDAYRQIPEYRLQNAGMSMAEFKAIYWWEWGHRQLGRVIGLVWAGGFAWFWLSGQMPAGWTRRLLLLGALGGLQGAIGWWMVASGLSGDRTDVASYRLATHLGLAFAILGLIAWYALRLGRRSADLLQARRAREGRLFGLTTGLMHMMMLQIVLGALVAGIDAGRAWPEWPTMGGGLIPPDPFELSPWWRNFFENSGLVQFIHRSTGYLLAVFAAVVWWLGRRSPHLRTRRVLGAMMALVAVQVAIGVLTVLWQAQVHVALTHQLTAVALWVAILACRFQAGYPAAQSVRGRT